MKTNRAIALARGREERERGRDWLVALMTGEAPKAMTKDQYRALARQAFRISTAAFNDAWIWAIEDTGRHDWFEGKGRDGADGDGSPPGPIEPPLEG